MDVGNPHAVTFVPDRAALEDLDLTRAPAYGPAEAYPDGTNVEFVARLDQRRIAMRVFERGSGETRSCGTGTCAAAAAAAVEFGEGEAGEGDRPLTYRVDVPGGSVEVELGDGQSFLTGPAVLVADGSFEIDDAGVLSAAGKVHARA